MKLQKLWDIDPGYFHLKHAFKTILAIIITLVLTSHEALFIKLIAGLTAGFSMQGVIASTPRSRLVQIIILDMAYFAAFIAGLIVRESHFFSAITLIILGFAMNYARKFGLQTSSAPLKIWTLCFLATVIPFNDVHAVWNHLHIVLFALIISACINSIVFPVNYPELFISNTNKLLRHMAKGLLEIRSYLSGSHSILSAQVRFNETTKQLQHLLEINQTIEQKKDINQQNLSEALFIQHALVHIFSLMTDAFRILNKYEQEFPKSFSPELKTVFKQFTRWFAAMKMEQNYKIRVKHHELPNLPITINLQHLNTDQPTIILVLLNLKLSVNLLNQVLIKLFKDRHDITAHH